MGVFSGPQISTVSQSITRRESEENTEVPLMEKHLRLAKKTVQLIDMHCENEVELCRTKKLLANYRHEWQNQV